MTAKTIIIGLLCCVAWLPVASAIDSYTVASTNSYCGSFCSGEYFRSGYSCNGQEMWDASDGKTLYKWGSNWILGEIPGCDGLGYLTGSQCAWDAPSGCQWPSGVSVVYRCPSGQYRSSGTSCVSCAAGRYQSSYGQSSCLSCPAGQYQYSTGQSSCRSCPAGTTSPSGSDSSYDCTTTATCEGATIDTSPGTISDGSSSSSDYANGMACSWTLQCPTGQTVSLLFSRFNTESCCDHVGVYDGSSTSSTRLAYLSGSTVPSSSFLSTERSMHIAFSTDGSVIRTGWGGSWACRSCAEETIDTSPGTISDGSSSSSDYANGMACSWTLQCPTGQTVSLLFSRFNTESCCDHVGVYDGSSTSSTRLAYLSGSTVPSSSFLSTERSMHIAFSTDYSATRTGWGGSWACERSASSVELTGQATYTIEIETIPLGSAARAAFEDEFTAAIADTLAVQTEDVVINSITSVRVRTHPSGSSCCT